MPNKPLSDLLTVVTDRVVPTSDQVCRYVGLEHLASGGGYFTKIGSTQNVVGVCGKFSVDDILFGKLRPNLRKCAQADVEGLCSTEILVLRTLGNNCPQYAAQIARSDFVFGPAEKNTEGTRMPRTSWRTLSNLQVFVPAPSEQKYIAKVLSCLDERIDQQTQEISKLRFLKEALLQEHIERLAFKGDSAPLRPHIKNVASGYSANGEDRTPLAGEFGVLKTSAVTGGLFQPHEAKTVDQREIKLLKCPVTAGTIIFSRMNTPALVGESAYVEKSYEGLFLPDRLWALTVDPESNLNVRWLSLVLQTQSARRFISRRATGTSGSMKNISKSSLLSLPLNVPRPEEQKRGLCIVENVSSKIFGLTEETRKLAQLRTGLRNDLLSGRVRVTETEAAAE